MIVLRLKSGLGKEEVLARIREIEGVQAFSVNGISSELHLKSAWEKANGKTIASEFLLWAGASTKISEAIERVGIESGGDFLVAGEFEKKRMVELLEAEELEVSYGKEEELEKRFLLDRNALMNYSHDELVLEKVALSRV